MVTLHMQRNCPAPLLLLFLSEFFCLTEFGHNPCSASARCTVDIIWCAIAQRLVRSFRVVKHKVFRQSLRSLLRTTPLKSTRLAIYSAPVLTLCGIG